MALAFDEITQEVEKVNNDLTDLGGDLSDIGILSEATVDDILEPAKEINTELVDVKDTINKGYSELQKATTEDEVNKIVKKAQEKVKKKVEKVKNKIKKVKNKIKTKKRKRNGKRVEIMSKPLSQEELKKLKEKYKTFTAILSELRRRLNLIAKGYEVLCALAIEKIKVFKVCGKNRQPIFDRKREKYTLKINLRSKDKKYMENYFVLAVDENGEISDVVNIYIKDMETGKVVNSKIKYKDLIKFIENIEE